MNILKVTYMIDVEYEAFFKEDDDSCMNGKLIAIFVNPGSELAIILMMQVKTRMTALTPFMSLYVCKERQLDGHQEIIRLLRNNPIGAGVKAFELYNMCAEIPMDPPLWRKTIVLDTNERNECFHFLELETEAQE